MACHFILEPKLELMNVHQSFVDAILTSVYEFFVKFIGRKLGFMESPAYLSRRMFKQDLIRNI